MRSVVLQAPHRIVLQDASPPGVPGPDEARVRVDFVGVCGTDLHAYAGKQAFIRYPVVPGHELAVTVEELGPRTPAAAPELRVGDRCAVLPYLSDGCCQACMHGRENCCERLQVLGVHVDGGMREGMVLPVSALLPANDLPSESLALVEMLAVGAHAVSRAQLRADDTVLIIGAGPIGLSCLVFARKLAQRVALADRRADRVALVGDLTSSDVLLTPPSPPDGTQAADQGWAKEAFGGMSPTVVIDATGHAASMEATPSIVGPGGNVVFVGHTTERLRFHNPDLHRKELSLATSRNATRRDFEDALLALRDGTVDVRSWITDWSRPETYAQDLTTWLQPTSGMLKAMVTW